MKKAYEDTIMSLYADLEWALIQELELLSEPSEHLMTSVREWAIALYDAGNGPMEERAFESAMELTDEEE